MGLKRSNKANAQFNMSSLTDIIFLLLIFFMLTSNFVQIRPFDLPKSDSQTVAPTNIVVELEKSGALRVNNITVTEASVLAALSDALEQTNNQKDATVTIVAETGVPFSRITPIMNLAAQRRARAIIATQPIQG
ncbi:biopolymer transport protein ExbD [Lewinella aquimaris]|uniref:Biopolymer transport protein ExbD n=1 Tax=Neolewinella aquimaris TaxID=1835722 RepID=A0A840E3D9_9BACT|nr:MULTISPECIES: biopolymer transporter ExbD [Lewinellaceae]MBB4077567.1 biopolymer transport protein ExbD [Neolewinella aquimaris]MCP9237329.1 biopolymer transporter ExbD [Lewinella sp. JB7]